MVIFGDSLSDVGNTTHLLKSLRREDNPDYIVAPFKKFVINKMNDFANDYYVPQMVLDAGIVLVNDFFANEVAYCITTIVSKVRLVPLLPGEPYWNNRFSNGRVWSEYLADMLSISRDDEETYTNRAFGGSWAATYDKQLTVWNLIRYPIGTIRNLIVGKLVPPSLGLSVQAYLLEHPKVNSDSVYFIFAGGNDYLNILQFDLQNDAYAMSSYVDNVLDNLSASVDKLIHAGAEHVVMMGLPYLGDTPRFASSQYKELLNGVIEQHNERLKQKIAEWKAFYPRTHVVYVDVHHSLSKAINNPRPYGFSNTSEACIDITFPMVHSLVNSPFATNYVLQYAQGLQNKDKRLASGEKNYHECKSPDAYLFWDEVHPSTKAHRYLALELCNSMAEQGFDVACDDN